MALTNCKECENEISKKAKECPSCGAPQGPKQYSIGKLIVIVGLGFFLYSLFSGDGTANRSSTSQNATGPVTITGTFHACETKEAFNHYSAFVVAGDRESFRTINNDSRCLITYDGMQVHRMAGGGLTISKFSYKGKVMFTPNEAFD